MIFFLKLQIQSNIILLKNNIKFNDINDTLIEIKNQFKNIHRNNEIIHMIIDNYILSEDDNFLI